MKQTADRVQATGIETETSTQGNLKVTVPQCTDGASIEGAFPEIGAVVGLRTEKVTKKVSFSGFVEKVADHVITNVKYGSDYEACIRNVQDPSIDFRSRHEPEPLANYEYSPFGVNWTCQESLKTYVSRENLLKDNIAKAYDLVWRQCTSV